MILTGEIAPGEVLIEPQLASRFETSKTPVREALQVLAAESLVTVLPKKGYLVATMTAQDLSEVLDLRMLLEPHAASEGALHAGSEGLAALRGHLDEQRRLSGVSALEAMESAAAFHRTLAGLSRNSRLSSALDRCFDETSRAHHVLSGLSLHVGSETEISEHERIFAAVSRGDAASAHEAMRTHLITIKKVTMSQWQARGGIWG